MSVERGVGRGWRMTYVLRAVIAGDALLRPVAGGRVAALRQGLSLMPVEQDPGEECPSEWAAWSAAGPVAFVEAEYFGGMGEQLARVWDRGALVLGPLRVEEGEPFPADGSPISQALRRLGARAEYGRDEYGRDEFSAVGLDRHRYPGMARPKRARLRRLMPDAGGMTPDSGGQRRGPRLVQALGPTSPRPRPWPCPSRCLRWRRRGSSGRASVPSTPAWPWSGRRGPGWGRQGRTGPAG